MFDIIIFIDFADMLGENDDDYYQK